MFMITLESNKLVWAGFDFRRSGLLTDNCGKVGSLPLFSLHILYSRPARLQQSIAIARASGLASELTTGLLGLASPPGP